MQSAMAQGGSTMGAADTITTLLPFILIIIVIAAFVYVRRSGRFSPKNAAVASTETFSASQPPAEGMSLKLKRSEISSRGTPTFALDARMEVSPTIQAQIEKYKLGSEIVYDSTARQGHATAAADQFDAGAQSGALKSLYRIGRGSLSLAMASLSLRITIDSLLRGVHVECKSLSEIQEAEQAITQAGKNLKGYIEAANSFDGREQVIEL